MKNNKKLILIIVGIVLLIGIGVGAWLFLGKEEKPVNPDDPNKPVNPDDPNKPEEPKEEEKLVDGELTNVYSLVNIDDDAILNACNTKTGIMNEDVSATKTYVIDLKLGSKFVFVSYDYKKGDKCNLDKGLKLSLKVDNEEIFKNVYGLNKVAKLDNNHLWIEKGNDEAGYNIVIVNDASKVTKKFNYKPVYGTLEFKKDKDDNLKRITVYCDSNIKEYPVAFKIEYSFENEKFTQVSKDTARNAQLGNALYCTE